jgi:hypothetical protein
MNRLNSPRQPKAFNVSSGHIMALLLLAGLAQIAMCASVALAPMAPIHHIAVASTVPLATNAPMVHDDRRVE